MRVKTSKKQAQAESLSYKKGRILLGSRKRSLSYPSIFYLFWLRWGNMRKERVEEELERLEIEGFVTADPYDIFYLTGLFPSAGRLLIRFQEMLLFLDGRYSAEARSIAPCEVIETREYDAELLKCLRPEEKIGFSETESPWGRVKKWMESGFPFVPVNDPIAKARQIKEPSEIVLMRKAAEMVQKGYLHIERSLKKGISEKELATLLEIYWLENGGYHPSFPPIVGFGKGTAYPHYNPKSHRFTPNDSVQIDIGVEVEHYQSDMSRYILPSEDHPLAEIFLVVKKAQDAALDAIKPGVPLKELDKIAREIITKAGYGEYFPHSLGHGIGLEVHEGPTLRSTSEDIAELGMCFTIEPGIYLPGKGGVRLEETVIVTQNGHEVITR